MEIPPISSVPSTASLETATSQGERLAHLYQLLGEESTRSDDGEAKKRRIQAPKARIARLTEKPETPAPRFDGQSHLLDTLA